MYTLNTVCEPVRSLSTQLAVSTSFPCESFEIGNGKTSMNTKLIRSLIRTVTFRIEGIVVLVNSGDDGILGEITNTHRSAGISCFKKVDLNLPSI